MITEVLQRVLPTAGRALEIASGSGEHVVTFAEAMPQWHFTPSDIDPSARASVDAWVAEIGLTNVAGAVELDARTWPWPVTDVDAIVVSNMVHISPWEATTGLLAGAGRALNTAGRLMLYGPFFIDGQSVPSNEAFDASLRAQDERWGVRQLRDVQALAEGHGLTLAELVPMPANNHIVVLQRG